MFGFDLNAIIADNLIKPYLDKYFGNFDADNFSLSTSGTTLTDLQFRPDLLEVLQLDLPFQANVLGRVGKIYIEIGFLPISITVTVSDTCLVVSSLKRLSYDEKKETKLTIERKRKELEEIIKQSRDGTGTQDKKADSEPSGLVKVAISYVQEAKVHIENVHVRFEEESTEKEIRSSGAEPFAVGLQLESLKIDNIDKIQEWTKGLTVDSFNTLCKKGDMKGLSIYWNSSPNEEMFGKGFKAGDSKTAQEKAIKDIAVKLKNYLTDKSVPKKYLLQPIAASVKAMITKRPEKDEKPFGFPKFRVDFKMDAINIDFNDVQYGEILTMQDYVNLLTRGRQWLKIRPTVPIKGLENVKKWWQMAKGNGLRRKQNWSWEHIKAHRALRDKYASLYLRKLTEEKPSEKFLKEVQDVEDQLDNFNVLLARRETEEKNSLRAELYKQKQAEANKHYWGWGNASFTVTQEEIDKYIKERYTEEERKKVYKNLDYNPDTGEPNAPEAPVMYPKDYSSIICGMNLKGIGVNLIKVKNEPSVATVLHAELNLFRADVETKPGASGLKVVASMDNVKVTGFGTGGNQVPEIFTSVISDKQVRFIETTYEVNSPTSKADQKIVFHLQQSQFTYDYPTFQKIKELFTPPPKKIQQVGGQSIWSGFTQLSGDQFLKLSKTTGTLEIDIKITAPNILVPQNGIFTKNEDCVILQLGTLTVSSSPREKSEVDPKAIESLDQSNINPQILSSLFNHFEIKLTRLQVIFALKGEDVHSLLYEKGAGNPRPIAATQEIAVNVYQCIISEDVRLPKLKAGISIPAITFDSVDSKLLRLARLGLTLPLPKSVKAGDKELLDKKPGHEPLVLDMTEDPNANYQEALANVTSLEIAAPKENAAAGKVEQFTNVIADFNLQDIKIALSIAEAGNEKPFLEYQLHDLTAGVKLQTFAMGLDARLGGMNVIYSGASVPGISGPLYLLNALAPGQEQYLVKCHLNSITSDCPPELAGPIKQEVAIDIADIDLILHQESIQSIMSFLFRLKNELDAASPKNEAALVASRAENSASKPDAEKANEQPSEIEKFRRRVSKKFKDSPDSILLKAVAKLSRLSIKLTSKEQQITQISLLQLTAVFEDKAKNSRLTSGIGNFEVLNLESGTKFPKILSVEGDSKLVSLDVVIQKQVKISAAEPEMKLKLSIGGPRLVLLGSYVRNVKKFAEHFQAALAAVSQYSGDAGSKAVSLGNEFLYQNDKKLSLDFTIASPTVVLARSDESLEVLYFNFGNVTVKNQLSQGETVGDRIVVLDTLTLDLEGMELSRAILDEQTKNPIAECILLQPLKVQLSLVRNLSKSWYTSIPQLKLTAALLSAIVTASDDDAIFTMKSCMDLISKVIVKDKQQLKEDRDNATANTAVLEDTPGIFRAARSINVVVPRENAVLLDFNISINEVGVALYQGVLPLAGKSGIVQRERSQALGGVSKKRLTAIGNVYVNNNLNVKLGLGEISVQDTRPDAEAIKDMVIKDPGSTTPGNLMDLSFKMENGTSGSDQVYTVDFDSRKFTLIFNMNFINAVIRSAIKVLDQIPTMMKTLEDPEEHDIQDVIDTSAAKQPAGTYSKPPFVNANVNLGEITVVVLENPKSVETNAVLVTCSGRIKVGTADGVTQGKAEVQLGSFTSNFDIRDPKKRQSEILRPTSLTVDLVFEPNMRTQVDAVLSDVVVHYSAGTLRLMFRIATEFSNSLESSRAVSKTQEDLSNIWKPKKLAESKFWFLQTQEIAAVLGFRKMARAAVLEPIEVVSLKTGKVFVTLESGVGTTTTPLLFLDGSLSAQVKNWTKELQVFGVLKLALGYNNPYVGAMEYLLEPNEVIKRQEYGDPIFAPLELKFNVEREHQENDGQKKDKYKVDLKVEKSLELMISKSAIEIVQTVSESFSTAATSETETDNAVTESHLASAPYVFKNYSGANLTLNVDGTSLLYFVDGEIAGGNISVKDGESVNFAVKSKVSEADAPRQINVTIPQYQFSSTIHVDNPRSRYFNLQYRTSGGNYSGLLFDVEISRDYSTHITVRTAVQIINELELPVEVCMEFGSRNTGLFGIPPQQKQVASVGVVKAMGTMCLPFNAIHDPNNGLMFKPQGYAFGQTTYKWQDLVQNTTQNQSLMSESTPRAVQNVPSTFNFYIVGRAHEAINGNTNQVVVGKNYSIRLRAPLGLRNLLPVPIEVISQDSSGRGPPEVFPVRGGKERLITSIQPSFAQRIPGPQTYTFLLRIKNYLGQDWTTDQRKPVIVSGEEKTDPGLQTKGTLAFISADRANKIYLNYDKIIESNVAKFIVYAAHWAVNFTGLKLSYLVSGGRLQVTSPEDGPVMLPNETNYNDQSNTKLMIGVPNLRWSQPTPIDPVALPLLVLYPGGSFNYEFSMSVELGRNHLTKIVTFKPKFTVANICSFGVNLIQNTSGTRSLISPNKVVPYYPTNNKPEALTLSFSVEGTSEVTPAAKINETNQQLLSLKNQYGGLCFNALAQPSKVAITVSEFTLGEIPLLFVNNTNDVRLQLSEENNELVLEPRSSLYHAWTNPLKDNRYIDWKVLPNGQLLRTDITQASTGTFQANNQNYKCLVFSSGLRNILLFTTLDDNVETLKMKREAFEGLASLEVTLIIQAIGLSLLDNINSKDILYGRVASSNVSWESAPMNTDNFHPFDQHQTDVLEAGYQFYLENHAGESVNLQLAGSEGYQVDFGRLVMVQPTVSRLKRGDQTPGLGLSFKQYPLGFDANLSINSIRMDNQLKEAVYPQILVSKESNSIPFLVLKFKKMLATLKSNISFINGTAALQEFIARADFALLGAILEVVGGQMKVPEPKFVDVRYGGGQDIDYRTKIPSTNEFYNNLAGDSSQSDQSPVWILNDLKIYKAKFTASFSTTGSEELKNKLSESSMVNLLLGSASAIGFGVKNVPLELEGIQYQDFRTTQKHLTSLLYDHYYEAVMKYANIWMLKYADVGSGSAVGAVAGVGKGAVSLLSETTEGAAKGDLFGGLVRGIGGAIGHTLGGVADTAGGLLGGLGKATNTLHVPIVGSVLGGTSQVLTGTAKLLTHGDDGPEIPKLRPPRQLEVGIPIKPFSTQSLIGSKIWSMLQNTPYYEGAGAFLSQIAFGAQVALLSQYKFFILDMPDRVNITGTRVVEWKSVQNLTTDGRSTLYIDFSAVDPRTRRPYNARIPVVTGSAEIMQYLIEKMKPQLP